MDAVTEKLAEIKLDQLRGVGPKVLEKLSRLHLLSVQDLLFHLPLRYQDRTRIVPIGQLRPGQEVVVSGQVLLAQIRYGKRRSLLVRIGDDTGMLTLRFFYFSKALQNNFESGEQVWCFGEVRRGPDTLEIVHPEFKLVNPQMPHTMDTSLTPVYPATDGLQQTMLRNLTDQALVLLAQNASLNDYLPQELLPQKHWPSLKSALQTLHRPAPDINTHLIRTGRHPAQQRLAFEELLAHHLSLRALRQKAQTHHAPVLDQGYELWQRLLAQLAFTPTNAQARVIEEIRQDLKQNIPMLRLVQGDVGSGKTLVAAAAVIEAVASAKQVAVMAPTDLLSEQHFQSFSRWLVPLDIPVYWLTGNLKAKAKQQSLQAIANGEAKVIIGTHALFQNDVEFNDLALIIIDEQHRFGVDQRLALREKGRYEKMLPHQLSMTATPIPRTLAMTAYADLSVSTIDELPAGRQEIETVAIAQSRRPDVMQRLSAACDQGRQVYWVCPLIEESDLIECQAAEISFAQLREALPQVKIGLVHGRMKSQEKEYAMTAFKQGKLQILVATTVIEVGVDVPNASLMVIENAERLGLAQLHQLRGRVGRGAIKSSCLLLYKPPLSQTAKQRLACMRETNDGFVIAQRDLELRGPGELLGTRQTGLAQMRVADIERDYELLPQVVDVAEQLIEHYPKRMQALIDRWLPQGDRYAEA